MCEYCKNMCNSDDAPSAYLGETDIGNIMGIKMSMYMVLQCYKNNQNGTYKIHSVFDVSSASEDYEISIKIHYCPFCGRKLD